MSDSSAALASAIQRHLAGDYATAEKAYRQILMHDPQNADAWHLLGTVAGQLGRHEVAIQCITAALQINPQLFEAFYNLGNSYRVLGRIHEAFASYAKAIDLNPSYAPAHVNLAILLYLQGDCAKARALFERAVALQPDSVEAYTGLGATYEQLGDLDRAVEALRQAVSLNPGSAAANNNLGNALRGRAQIDDAIACYRAALALQPDDWAAHSNLVYTLNFAASYDSAQILEAHQQWNAQQAEQFRAAARPHANEPSAKRRLRIGYVSPHFRDHVLANYFLPLFRTHDHGQFEIYCYSDVMRPDAVTTSIRDLIPNWRHVAGFRDQQLADIIRNDAIDILVDCTMHMEGSRLLAFARKPAPVQVAYFAYPGTTGLAAMDYRITDPYLDPPGETDQNYSERSVRLPSTFWCYDPLYERPEPNELPALRQHRIAFGCFSNFCKVQPQTLKLWSEVLLAVRGSTLWLMAPEGYCRQWATDQLGKRGISPDRIVFVARRPMPGYFELYHHVDIMLDTLPYNGHTTSLDAFWMGVPVVTLVGQTIVGRAGLSQLSNLGLTELAASSPGQFVQIATTLAADLDRLSQLRHQLRARMRASPLMDYGTFTRELEAVYRSMWKTWCIGHHKGE